MAPRATGSLRARRSGGWEIRIAVATDPVTGRTVQRSFSFHGTAAQAEARCAELAAEYAERRAVVQQAPFLTIGELLVRWLAADHDWKPSTWVGYRSNVRGLTTDTTITAQRVVALTPHLLRQAMARWAAAGATPSVVAGRFRTLRAAIGWAYDERIIDRHPINTMRGPPGQEPRLAVPTDALRQLLRTAEERVEKSQAEADLSRRGAAALHLAEQDHLLIRLAADAGARRGELVALRVEDLDGRVLTICRAASMGEITTTKTGRTNRLTLSLTTAELWHGLDASWRARLGAEVPFGPWLFSPDADHARGLTTTALGHRFAKLRDRAGVETAMLHGLRHSVATFLVGRGQLLKAQARLGHRDASTTLRHYAHAIPLDDLDVAEAIEALLAREEDQR